MQLATDPPSSYTNRSQTRSRVVAAVAALVITALIILLLFELGIVTPEPPPNSAIVSLSLLPGSSSQATKAKAAPRARASAKSAARAAAPRPTAAIPPPIVPPPPHPVWNVIPMTHNEMISADLSNLPSHRDGRMAEAGDATGRAAGTGAGDAGGQGDGPGGARLYDAEWYRRPTHAEMATYIPPLSQSGWGMVACRTAPQFRVEDCRELDESPGSHLARAVREAAWQFRVLPPRVNGQPQIGVWVRIRFDVSVNGEADAAN